MGVQQLTRRGFLRSAAAFGAAVGFAGVASGCTLDEKPVEEPVQDASEIKRIRSCCRACGKMECGVWVNVKDGKVISTEGDESAFHSMGNHCSKGQASLQAAYHPDRVRYPMKRTNPKGDADPGWVRITWDEAMQTTAEKLKEIKEKEGGPSIIMMCGTSRIWSMASYSALPQLFDSPNQVLGWQICKGPRHLATALQSSFNWSWMATGDRPATYVSWGAASEISNYDEAGRTTVDIAKTANDYIVCDPRMTSLGHEATKYNQMVPGTDGALALAWIHTIIEDGEGLDMPFILRWTNAPYLVVPNMDPSGDVPIPFVGGHSALSDPTVLKTRLLKECDLVEGGSPNRWMVWDSLAGSDDAHPLHEHGMLTWYDSSTCLWEGEPEGREVEFYDSPQQDLLTAPGRVAKIQSFDPEIAPAIEGSFKVTLKDGKEYDAFPVWQKLKEHAAAYAPELVSDIVGIDAQIIRDAALAYAHRVDFGDGRDYGNGGIQYMLALEHACNALQNNRMMDLLVGITGNMDTPAGNRGGSVGTLATDAQTMMASGYVNEKMFADWGKYRLGAVDIPMLNWWQRWSDAHATWQAVLTGDPYRPKAVFCQSGDHMVMANSLESYEALKSIDFMVVLDMWKTPTAGLADIFLPVAHWLETDCPRLSQGSTGAQGATVRAINPPGECRTDMEIILDLYSAFDTPWVSDLQGEVAMAFGPITKQMLQSQAMMQTQDNGVPTIEQYLDYSVALTGMTWEQYKEDFQENGWLDCKVINPEEWGTYRRFETAKVRADGTKGFNTPTHKQELWSTVIESVMPGAGFELPTWDPAPRTALANPDIANEYPYLMTTGRRIPVYFHSEHRQLPWCRELWPVPKIEINPEDAAKLGIEQGDWVWVESNKGKIRQCVDIYAGIKPGTVNCEHQWWYPELAQADHGFQLSGVNCLVDGENRDPLCGASNLRAYNVNIYKATPENSPFGNPVPCGDDGTPIITSADDKRLKDWNAGILAIRENHGEEVE